MSGHLVAFMSRATYIEEMDAVGGNVDMYQPRWSGFDVYFDDRRPLRDIVVTAPPAKPAEGDGG